VSDLQIIEESDDPGPCWDTFVAAHSTGHLMQSRAWAAVLRDIGWTPFFLRIEERGAIQAVALLIRWRPLGCLPGLLYIPRGPVLDYANPEVCRIFATALSQVARRERACFIQTDPAVPAERSDVHARLESMGFDRIDKQGLFRIAQPLRVMRVPLDRYNGPEGLWVALPHKTRYNIGLASRKEVRVVRRTDRGGCLDFHRMLKETGRSKGFLVRGLRFHESLWRHCVQPGHGEYLFAEHAGRPLAAIHLLRFGTRTWYMYGATAAEERHRMAPYLLHWEGISRAWAIGSTSYDMRGVYSATPRPGDPEYGVFDFKRKFNAEMTTFLGEYDRIERPVAYRAWRRLESALQRPVGLAFRLLRAGRR